MEMPSLEQPMHRDGKRISDRENIGQFSGKALREFTEIKLAEDNLSVVA